MLILTPSIAWPLSRFSWDAKFLAIWGEHLATPLLSVHSLESMAAEMGGGV